jgi:hypothetical protein
VRLLTSKFFKFLVHFSSLYRASWLLAKRAADRAEIKHLPLLALPSPTGHGYYSGSERIASHAARNENHSYLEKFPDR